MAACPPPPVGAVHTAALPRRPATLASPRRRLSVLVHPDKNPGDDARAAFEALNEAHRALKVG